MTPEHYYNCIRLFNCVLYLTIFGLMIVRFRDYEEQRPQIRLFGTGMLGLLIAGFYSAVDLAVRGVPGSPRVVLTAIPLVLLLVACLWPQLSRLYQRLRAARDNRRRHTR